MNYIFGFIWGIVIAVILRSLGVDNIFITWQYWVGMSVPVIAVVIINH